MNFTESFTEEFASIEDDGEEEDEDDLLPLFTLDGKTEKEPDPPGSPEASASQDFPESPKLYKSPKPAKCPESSKSPERSKSQPRIEEITDEEKHSDVFTETSGAKRKKLDRQYKNYNLETLLRERKMTKQTDKELKQMKKELQQNIKGGKVQLQSINIEVSDDDLSAEHQSCLGKIEIRKETIQEVHSGDLVFRPPHYRCLFSYPGNLTPSNCGIAGSSPIDQHLVTLPRDMLLEFIAGDIIVLCYKNISKGHELLNWLFYLMSVHHKSLIILRCYHILSELLLLGTGSAVSWWPGPKLMATILTNYGADLEALSEGLIDESFTRFPIDPQQDERGEEASGYRQENLHNVLLILTEACEKRRNCMTDEDVKKIMMMLFKVSLDTTLITSTLRHDLMVCMAGLLEASSEEGWNDMILSLAGEIPLLTSHHHNRLSLVQLLPPCGRCEHFRRKLAYSMVQRILWGSFLVKDVASLRVEHILPILDLSHFSSPEMAEDIDFYLMSSVIRLADLAVGNEGLPSSERDDLHRLIERLRGLLSDVRHDDLRIMDRTVVKDLMHRILSKWMFMSHNMGKKQGTIFAWASQGSQNKPIVHGGCSKNEVENTQDES